MDTPEKILITPINLKFQKPTEIKDCYIQLFPDYLYYKTEFVADEPTIYNDEHSGWHSIYNNYEWIVIKKNIAGLEKSLTMDSKWGVYIIINGFQNNLRVYYKTQQPAQTLFNRIQEWLTEQV